MVFIYILGLLENKYYVGKTNYPSNRINDHYNGNGSSWTKKYKPVRICHVIPDMDTYDEDKYVIQYMNLYGIENVRGGSFSCLFLSSYTIDILKKMCLSANNRCYICKKNDHFSNECKRIYI